MSNKRNKLVIASSTSQNLSSKGAKSNIEIIENPYNPEGEK